MPPRTLASLAHALGAAGGVDDALLALGETLAELDRGAVIAFYPYDARRELLRVRLVPGPGYVERVPLDASLEHLPTAVRVQLVSGHRLRGARASARATSPACSASRGRSTGSSCCAACASRGSWRP
jgi:hypothetical protein